MAQLGSLYLENLEIRGAWLLQRSLASVWKFDAPEGFPEDVRSRLGGDTFDGKPLVKLEPKVGEDGSLPGVARFVPGEGLKALAIWAVENEWAHDRIKVRWSDGWPIFSWRAEGRWGDSAAFEAKLEYAESLGALADQQPLGSIEWKRALAMYELGAEYVRTFGSGSDAASPRPAEPRQNSRAPQSLPCSLPPAAEEHLSQQGTGADRSEPEMSPCAPSEACEFPPEESACRSVASNNPFVACCGTATIAGGAGESIPCPKGETGGV